VSISIVFALHRSGHVCGSEERSTSPGRRRKHMTDSTLFGEAAVADVDFRE